MEAKDRTKEPIIPEGRYEPLEVAALLGFHRRPKSIYEIPERQLPRTRVGAKRGKVMFMGRDILNYLERGRKAAS